MKQYLTATEYRNLGGKSTLPDAELDKWLQAATVKVDRLTFGRIRIIRLTQYQLDLLQRAMVAQTDYLVEIAGTVGLESGTASWSITDVSMGPAGNETPEAIYRQENNISFVAQEYLAAAGLTWRGV